MHAARHTSRGVYTMFWTLTFSSTIEQKYFGGCRRKMPLKMRLNAYWNALVKKLILRFGGFVSKIRR